MSRTYKDRQKVKNLSSGTIVKIGKKDYLSKHHLIPKHRVKQSTVPDEELERCFNRVLSLWRSKHDAWHHLFCNMTLGEIIAVLKRVESIKY